MMTQQRYRVYSQDIIRNYKECLSSDDIAFFIGSKSYDGNYEALANKLYQDAIRGYRELYPRGRYEDKSGHHQIEPSSFSDGSIYFNDYVTGEQMKIIPWGYGQYSFIGSREMFTIIGGRSELDSIIRRMADKKFWNN